jgi:universal stress protein A
MEIQHLLAPTDCSGPANRVVTAAFGLAPTDGAKLTVLPIVEPPSYLVDSQASAHRGPLPLAALEEQARRESDQLLSQLRGTPVELAHRVMVGLPYQRMTERASTEPVDLLVMATHGRTGLRHLVLGSVAERAVRPAPCPVPTIRPPGDRSLGLRTTVV